MNKINDIKNKNILLLQGPVGCFFKKLDTIFKGKGANTFRIGFNAGDSFFSNNHNYTPYKDIPNNWNNFIYKFFKEKKIHKIFLFGDCRFYQKIAIEIALNLNIEVFVFEDGYIRPNYITLEKYGVNDYSHLSRDPNFFINQDKIKIDPPKDTSPNPISNWGLVIIYYFVAKLFHFRYPNYLHHRNYSAIEEFFFGIRSLLRKMIYPVFEQKYIADIKGKLSGKYFFVPLQTHNDFQILQHSAYGSIEKFIIEILESFANNQQEGIYLIFKHHPIDRGRKNYKQLILDQAKQLNIEKNIIIINDLHLPTCLKNAIGTITINSTVGLSSLYHQIPTITLGNAIYDIDGLTCKDMNIDDFWTLHKKPDMELYSKYKNYLIKNTQLNASFYGKMPTL